MKIISRYPGATYRVEHLGNVYLAINDMFSEDSMGSTWHIFKEIIDEKGHLLRYEFQEGEIGLEVAKWISANKP